jgi:hypothetical protein
MTDAHFGCRLITADSSAIPDTLIDLLLNLNTLQATPCRLSATAYPIYSQYPPCLEAFSVHNLRTRCAMATREPLITGHSLYHTFFQDSRSLWFSNLLSFRTTDVMIAIENPLSRNEYTVYKMLVI